MADPTTMLVTGTWLVQNMVPAKGEVRFYANEPRFVNNGNIIEAHTIRAVLDTTGSISVSLVRCLSGYTVRESLDGLEDNEYTLGDSAGPVDLQAAGPTGPAGPGPARLTVSATPPSSPNINDLWVDIS